MGKKNTITLADLSKTLVSDVETPPVVDSPAPAGELAELSAALAGDGNPPAPAVESPPAGESPAPAVESPKTLPVKVIKNPKWRAAKESAPEALRDKIPAKELYIWSAGKGKAGTWYPHQLDGIDQTATFIDVVAENPKRKQPARRFAKIRNGMTVKAYIVACERYDDAKVCLNDLTWDLNRGFYRLELLNADGSVTTWNKFGSYTTPAVNTESDSAVA